MSGIKPREKLGQKCPNNLGRLRGWEGAIADAERKIGETKARLVRLKDALAFSKESFERGDPFPGEKSKSKKAA
jgi:hypothetical protein